MTAARPRRGVRVAVFAKAPVPGQVKTRLSLLLGADGAAALHTGLVRRALATAVASRLGPVELWCTPDETHPFFERCAAEYGLVLQRQVGEELGARMRSAFEHGLAAGDGVVLIGSDCPVLEPGDLRAAATAIESHVAALAPAEDGGYVLVALSRAVPELFSDIAWGTAEVMGRTRNRLAQLGIAWKELPMRWDVDRPEDYARLQREGLLAGVMS
ncbi:hypothetical protein BWI17_07460 [Betaproteobacteria bacterium GR16-43]|nr:hypothetical protein BWI17_07460 [Betaproteobacteria bacterium GR16-43]